MNLIQENDLNTAKLAHYNAWLLDANREFGTTYPGFPVEMAVTTKRARTIAADVVVEAIAKRARGTTTKLDQAKDLFKANGFKGRDFMIALFMTELSMSKAGATTYYYSAQK